MPEIGQGVVSATIVTSNAPSMAENCMGFEKNVCCGIIIKNYCKECFVELNAWNSYVMMNEGYNKIFDGWQNIEGQLSPDVNKSVNLALHILDEALTEVKRTVKPESRGEPALALGDSSAEESSTNGSENKKGLADLFNVFHGK